MREVLTTFVDEQVRVHTHCSAACSITQQISVKVGESQSSMLINSFISHLGAHVPEGEARVVERGLRSLDQLPLGGRASDGLGHSAAAAAGGGGGPRARRLLPAAC